MNNRQKSLRKLSQLAIVMLLCTVSGCASVNGSRNKDAWFAHDKAKHFVVSAAIGAGSARILKNNGRSACDAATAGIGISLTIGAGKEYYDKYIRKKYWSWKDMFWNLVGGTVGSHVATGCH